MDAQQNLLPHNNGASPRAESPRPARQPSPEDQAAPLTSAFRPYGQLDILPPDMKHLSFDHLIKFEGPFESKLYKALKWQMENPLFFNPYFLDGGAYGPPAQPPQDNHHDAGAGPSNAPEPEAAEPTAHDSPANDPADLADPSPLDQRAALVRAGRAPVKRVCEACNRRFAEVRSHTIYSCGFCSRFFAKSVKDNFHFGYVCRSNVEKCGAASFDNRGCNYCRYQLCVQAGMAPNS